MVWAILLFFFPFLAGNARSPRSFGKNDTFSSPRPFPYFQGHKNWQHTLATPVNARLGCFAAAAAFPYTASIIYFTGCIPRQPGNGAVLQGRKLSVSRSAGPWRPFWYTSEQRSVATVIAYRPPVLVEHDQQNNQPGPRLCPPRSRVALGVVQLFGGGFFFSRLERGLGV